MTRMSPAQNETRFELALTGKATNKGAYLRTGLLQEQQLTCANHSNEEIFLDQIGWQDFSCPKCGTDYSIGRKIAILERVVLV
jgi:predicted RNA-binding Zn-ribbon protein involved in translation (DUF1610 family)